MWIQYGSGSTTLHLTVHVNCLTAVIFICPDFSARDWAAGDFPPHCPASRQGFPRGSEPAALHLRGYQCRQDLHHPGQRQSLIRIQVNFEQWTLKYEDGIMLWVIFSSVLQYIYLISVAGFTDPIPNIRLITILSSKSLEEIFSLIFPLLNFPLKSNFKHIFSSFLFIS